MSVDVNYFSIANNLTNFNPNADPTVGAGQVGVPIPSPLVLNPINTSSFASILKVCDGTSNLSLGCMGSVVLSGLEGCVDFNNGAVNITITASLGGGSIGQRITSIKGGCNNIKIVGTVTTEGTETEHLIGQYSDQSRAVDKNIDLSATNGRVIIARGFFDYILGNKNNITLGANCKLQFWASFGSCCYVTYKSLVTKEGTITT